MDGKPCMHPQKFSEPAGSSSRAWVFSLSVGSQLKTPVLEAERLIKAKHMGIKPNRIGQEIGHTSTRTQIQTQTRARIHPVTNANTQD